MKECPDQYHQWLFHYLIEYPHRVLPLSWPSYSRVLVHCSGSVQPNRAEDAGDSREVPVVRQRKSKSLPTLPQRGPPEGRYDPRMPLRHQIICILLFVLYAIVLWFLVYWLTPWTVFNACRSFLATTVSNILHLCVLKAMLYSRTSFLKHFLSCTALKTFWLDIQ